MIPRTLLISTLLLLALPNCSQTEAPRSSAAEITEIDLSDVPENVVQTVMTKRPDFEMVEVLKKVRDGRVYYDVEGRLPGGDEIEFDVLMTESGPEIVEIQRDIPWSDVPQHARALVDEANTDNMEIVRIIESVQTDNSIIYEVFIAGFPSDPRFEVRVAQGQAELLPERWEH